MPQIQQLNTIDITVEKFLNACSDVDLIEIDMLLITGKFSHRLRNAYDAMDESDEIKKIHGPGEDVDQHISFLAGIQDIEVTDPELLDGHRGH